MLNNYQVNVGGNTSHTSINAVSGTLVKNHPYSFFERFHLTSDYAKDVLSKKPHFEEKAGWQEYKDVPIVVLQIMVVGDMEVVAEIVRKSDYDVPYEQLQAEANSMQEAINRLEDEVINLESYNEELIRDNNVMANELYSEDEDKVTNIQLVQNLQYILDKLEEADEYNNLNNAIDEVKRNIGLLGG